MNLKALLKKLNVCPQGVEYIGNKSALDAWNNCERGDWMLWIAKKQSVDLKILTLAKVRCARLVEHLMKDDRSIAALIAAERFANGEITREELDSAADDAYVDAVDADAYASDAYAAAAYAAAETADAETAYAAAADVADAAAETAEARKETLLKCANICRETIPFNLLNIEESL